MQPMWSSQGDNLRGHFKIQSDSALLGTTHQLTAIICHPGSSRLGKESFKTCYSVVLPITTTSMSWNTCTLLSQATQRELLSLGALVATAVMCTPTHQLQKGSRVKFHISVPCQWAILPEWNDGRDGSSFPGMPFLPSPCCWATNISRIAPARNLWKVEPIWDSFYLLTCTCSRPRSKRLSVRVPPPPPPAAAKIRLHPARSARPPCIFQGHLKRIFMFCPGWQMWSHSFTVAPSWRDAYYMRAKNASLPMSRMLL